MLTIATIPPEALSRLRLRRVLARLVSAPPDDVETIFRVKSDLHFEIFRRFKGEKFFDTPGPDATKVEIVGFENLGRFY